jgi:hypothetical protein
MSYSIPIIAIPAGKCPAKLSSTEYNDVIDWAEQVYAIGIKNNVNYLPSALVFFAQQFFNIFSEEYKTVCNHINSAYNNQDKQKLDSIIEKISQDKKEEEKRKDDGQTQEQPKKRRGRPPKKLYEPSKTFVKTDPEEKAKIKLRRR